MSTTAIIAIEQPTVMQRRYSGWLATVRRMRRSNRPGAKGHVGVFPDNREIHQNRAPAARPSLFLLLIP
jgi:hypothetical protein